MHCGIMKPSGSKLRLSEGGTPPRFLIIDDGWQQIGNEAKDSNCVVQEGAQDLENCTRVNVQNVETREEDHEYVSWTSYTQQSYKVSDIFPFKWINKKRKEGFSVTSMSTAGSRWGVVMSRAAGYSNQVVELDFLYPSEGIHRRWENGYRITSTAATLDQAAFILSTSKKKLEDVTQETLRTSAFPSTHVKVQWDAPSKKIVRPQRISHWNIEPEEVKKKCSSILTD
ncbi:Casein kinase 1-like protein HD16 [Camellia lanceoleosa]|uniref:Casein kinase 1-like protein HD16 n=1 Tax=Camellia lanceoleosa TaxID=1840588 RepID=A0ACC0IH25_9ERIC|nr:Casein kinase 1-like protein HD16 [Camellia lanceoleosa]